MDKECHQDSFFSMFIFTFHILSCSVPVAAAAAVAVAAVAVAVISAGHITIVRPFLGTLGSTTRIRFPSLPRHCCNVSFHSHSPTQGQGIDTADGQTDKRTYARTYVRTDVD